MTTLIGKSIPCPIHKGKGQHDIVLEPHPTERKRVIAKCGNLIVFTADADKTITAVRKIAKKV